MTERKSSQSNRANGGTNKSIVVHSVRGGTVTSIGLQRSAVKWSENDKQIFGSAIAPQR